MSKNKAFLDTTILADVLTKTGKEKTDAKAALAKYEQTETPFYAIKELKAGVLDYVKYLHNKLLETKNVGRTIVAINKLNQQPNRRSTAMRVIGELIENFEILKADQKLKSEYGSIANDDVAMYDKVVLDSKVLLFLAWSKRHKVAKQTVFPLPCYEEKEPVTEKNGELSLKPRDCFTECCLFSTLVSNRFQLTKLKVAIESLPANLKNKQENQKRIKILREINSNQKRKLTNQDCRNLGDIIFAILCPTDAEILTTNIKDHVPLAKALGKDAVAP